MKRLGNVLYVLTEGSYLHCQNETIAVKVGNENKARIPAHTIEAIICLCNTTVSSALIGFCGEKGISLSFHLPNGKFLGRIHGQINGNVLLRKKQFECINKEMSLEIVRNILSVKFSNSRNLLLKSSRQKEIMSLERLRNAADMLSQQHNLLMGAETIDSMRGIEGAAANIYFGVFDNMIISDNEEMMFKKRSKRPPENRVNAMLSFTYMLLKNDVQSALESVGLDPAVGYLHTLRPGRPSLALDIMEELRSPLCDRFVISLINLKQIQSDDFEISNGEFMLRDKARRLLIDTWQKRKREEIVHPFFEEKIAIGLIPYCQALLLSKHLRGDIDGYPPFFWR